MSSLQEDTLPESTTVTRNWCETLILLSFTTAKDKNLRLMYAHAHKDCNGCFPE